MSRRIVARRVVSGRLVVSCHVVSVRAVSSRIGLRRVVSCRIVSGRVVSRRALSRLVQTNERQTSKGTNKSDHLTKIDVGLRTLFETKVRNFRQVGDKSSQLQNDIKLSILYTYRVRNIMFDPPLPPDFNVG